MNYFFDIGANIGTTFDWFLTKTREYDGWEVYCFEPSPRHLGSLLRKAEEMSDRFNVTVIPVAVRGVCGVQRLFEKTDPNGDSLVKAHCKNRDAQYVVLVSTVSLSRFILANTKPFDKIVLKLDCEGAEYEIVEDLLRNPDALKRVTTVMVEWHGDYPVKRQFLTEAMQEVGSHVHEWEH